MPRRNALYFPYINVPASSWFLRILLYWDKVSSIVPSDFAYNPDKLEPHMQQLLVNGLVEQVIPAQYLGDIQDFGDSFLEFVNHNLGAQGGQSESGNIFPIHMEKLGQVSDHLVEMGVARHVEYPWLEVDDWVARAFMTYLSTSLGCLDEVQAAPVTQDLEYLKFLQTSNAGLEGSPDPETLVTTSVFLEDLLPYPDVDYQIDDLMGFKQEHSDQLASFRNLIERKCAEVRLHPRGLERDRQIELIREELTSEAENIVDAMTSRWKRVAFGTICGIVSGGLTTWQAVQGQDPLAIAGTAFGLIPSLYSFLSGDDRYRNALEKPLAYAALANIRFGSSSA